MMDGQWPGAQNPAVLIKGKIRIRNTGTLKMINNGYL